MFLKDRPNSGHKRVYKPGPTIKTMNELTKILEIGEYTFWGLNRRAFHAGWVRGFQLGYVMWNLRAGNVRKAVKI